MLQLCFLSAAAAAVAVHLSVKLVSDLYVCFVPNFHLFLCLFDALFFLCLFSHLSVSFSVCLFACFDNGASSDSSC